MKKLVILILLFQYHFCYSQYDTAVIKRIFKASVIQVETRKLTGYLAAFGDTTLFLADKAPMYGLYSQGQTSLTEFGYSGIEKVVIRRKGSTGRGFLYGALIGLGAGAIAGLASGNDPPGGIISFTAGQKAIFLGAAGVIPGTVIGGIVGSIVRKRFRIGGRKERFDTMRARMLDRMYGSKQ